MVGVGIMPKSGYGVISGDAVAVGMGDAVGVGISVAVADDGTWLIRMAINPINPNHIPIYPKYFMNSLSIVIIYRIFRTDYIKNVVYNPTSLPYSGVVSK